jgi:hypothetical protein
MTPWSPSLWINGDEPTGRAEHAHNTRQAAAFEQSVVNQLNIVNQNPVGRIVLESIAATDRLLIIHPWRGPGRNASVQPIAHSAVADRRGVADGGVVDATQRGAVVHTNAGPMRQNPGNSQSPLVHGSGVGRSSRLFYTPGNWNSPGLRWTPGASPDALLAHELFHAYRNLHGTRNTQPTGDQYQSIEEFFAVLVGNLYISAAGGEWFRGGVNTSPSALAALRDFRGGEVNPFSVMPGRTGGPSESREAAFERQYAERIRTLHETDRILFERLAQVRCSFNPLRVSLERRATPAASRR